MLVVSTVGTGTAGKYSNLAAGLVAGLRQLKPRAYWLVPSTSADSHAIADLVRGEVPGCQPWSDTEDYRCIAEPDNLGHCRAILREILLQAGTRREDDETVVLNPTSGTKQMSAGAVLAGLDLEWPRLVFITGERADGVVRTGTERLSPFDPATLISEKRLRDAEHLFTAGAVGGAAELLRRSGSSMESPAAVAAICEAWQRLDLITARALAARHPAGAPFRAWLERLQQAGAHGEARVADLLANARRLLAWRLWPEALLRFYQAIELTGHAALTRHLGAGPPYPLAAITGIPGLDPKLAARCRANAREDGLHLAPRAVRDVLSALGDPYAEAWSARAGLEARLDVRNRWIHQAEPVAKAIARGLGDDALVLAETVFPGIGSRLPTGLWPTRLPPPTP
ncbi:MAG: hypothetical protein EA425_00120 [Puniceicoccaceae bacterium]|nr:MAG: hypothetical protein EA425_00120 [Puniceicoccaceae bacterium]